MRRLLPYLSLLALLATLAPSLAYLAGWLSLGAMKTAMLVATVVWFATVPFWMGKSAGR